MGKQEPEREVSCGCIEYTASGSQSLNVVGTPKLWRTTCITPSSFSPYVYVLSLSLAFSFEDVERGSYCKTFSHINYGHPSRYLGKGWQILAAKYWPQCHKFDLVNSLSKKSLH